MAAGSAPLPPNCGSATPDEFSASCSSATPAPQPQQFSGSVKANAAMTQHARVRDSCLSSATVHPSQFGFLRWREVELGGMSELLLSLAFASGIEQSFAPFQVQAAPVGRVFLRVGELFQRQVRLVLRHQCLAP